MNGRMPSPVGCPVCGADGTAAANAAIAQCQPALMAAAPPPARVVSLHAATPAPALQVAAAAAAAYPAAARRPTLLPGQLERPQAETEARAKILWGDPPEEVVKFLMRQGVPAGEASEIVNALFQQRAATIRTNGITKIVTGCAMICVPIAAWLIFASMGTSRSRFLPSRSWSVCGARTRS